MNYSTIVTPFFLHLLLFQEGEDFKEIVIVSTLFEGVDHFVEFEPPFGPLPLQEVDPTEAISHHTTHHFHLLKIRPQLHERVEGGFVVAAQTESRIIFHIYFYFTT